MSTAPALPAGAAAAPQGAPAAPASDATPPATPAAAPTSKSVVAKGIRDRVLTGKKMPDATPPVVPPAAGAPAAPVVPDPNAPPPPPEPPKPRVHKVKEGPALPAAPAPGAPDGRSVEQIVRDVLPAISRENAPAAPAAPTLDPDLQREIDLATFAERKNPDRYAGMAGKIKTFFTSHDELLNAKSKELGGQKSGEFKDWLESDEYKTWLATNRPAYQRGDKAKLSEDMIADRARAEARREMEPEFTKLERRQRENELAPQITRATTHLVQNVILVDPAEKPEDKDPAIVEFKKDPMKFGEAHPEEARLIAAEAGEAVDLIQEVYRIDNNLVDFNPQAPTPKQAKIREFTIGQNAALRTKHPNGVQMADGKILIDAETYHRLGLHKNPEYRVFSADEIAGMIAATGNAQVLTKLKQRREGVAKSVYAPRAPAAPAAPTVPPTQENGNGEHHGSPTAPASAAPGGRGTPTLTPIQVARRKALTGK